MKKAVRFIYNLILHLLAVSGLAWVFWPFINQALQVIKLPGSDSDQFIFYTHHFGQRFVWPPAGWDNLWYEGVPRVLNMTFLHFYLIQPLVGFFGLNLATKIYPLFWLGIFFLFSYLLFYRLAKSHLIAFGLTFVLIHCQVIYLPIWENGVVLSGLAQMVFPAILFFLVLFAQEKQFRYLVLAATCLAFQFYSHGGMALFFGLASALILFVFYRSENEKWLSWQPIKRTASFGLITLAVGALAIFPQMLSSFGGGYYRQGAFAGLRDPVPNVFQLFWENTNPALFLAFGLAGVTGIIFYKKLKSRRLALPLLVMLVYILIFLAGMIWSLNPLADYLFCRRVFWYLTLTLAALSAALFSGLADFTKPVWKGLSLFGQLAIAGSIVGLVLTNSLDPSEVIRGKTESLPSKAQGDEQLLDIYQNGLKGIWDRVDQQDANYRTWLHALPKIYWNIVSDVPLLQGYFHFYTSSSRVWTSWLYAAIAERAEEMQALPEGVAEKQALFLIDWYALKYLAVFPDPEFNVVSRFWQDDTYIASRSGETPPAVLTISPEFTSGIVEAVNVPVVGFVGKQSGYDAFLRNLAMLNLNTRYLIPLRLTDSIDKIPQKALEEIDLLVLYNFEGKNWNKIEDFVQKGGKVWIESGGQSSFREGENLPAVFPNRKIKHGSLGKNWQAETAEELARIDFEKLAPLDYRGDPWKLFYVPDNRIESGQVLLSQAGKPIITEQQIGQGKVLWSGVNLWYRPMEYLKESGLKEAEILRALMQRLTSFTGKEPIQISLERPRSEKILVSGQGIGGVVLKENFLPGWKAKANGKSLSFFPAGPDLMYFPLPADLKDKPVEVEITYQGPLVYWLLFFVSIFSLFLAAEEIVTNGFLARKAAASSLGKRIDPERLFKTISGWWEKGEEE